MDTNALLKEIRETFPIVNMPTEEELRFHKDGCPQCVYLSQYLNENRNRHVGGEMIRYMHQELSCLSAAGWLWALPHYLPYCLTPEAEYNQMETEFLLYSLRPAKEYQSDTKARLSSLSNEQLTCLINFVKWMRVHPKWKDYFLSDIEEAITFLQSLRV